MFSFFKDQTKSHPIYFQNSLTGKKELFTPLRKNHLLLYSCGPTVYDYIHIGNLRAYILPDIVQRLFLSLGYKINFTMNVTDFGHLTDDADEGEDKIMKGMKREGYEITLENMRTFTQTYIDAFKNDIASIGNLGPTRIIRASDYVPQQIKLIESLLQKGYAYKTSDGIYFDISRFPKYGQLGNVDLNQIKSGARVETNPEKRHPADFALWKNGELGFEAKWGCGFPGWHIECTAMIFATLGKQIDIHTGGEDLKYTHHNGEIAQAECVTGKKYVNYWLHNAFVNLNEEKLSKSTGNIMSLKDLQEAGFEPLDYRYLVLNSHYRTPLNFTTEAITGARDALWHLRQVVYNELGNIKPGKTDEDIENQVFTALSDDLDTPKAISILWKVINQKEMAPETKLATIHAIDNYLGLGLSQSPEEGRRTMGYVKLDDLEPELQNLVKEREEARTQKNWQRADANRKIMEKRGYILEDTKQGTFVRKLNNTADGDDK